ncbi:hypothetical protein H5410_009749 [Solanum commersonii]|uniref:Uncharacterized protein n=1 Tax=Solanum commersonii TaxID=4109 RepID=A0A9J6AJN5_SOLCO|nr:hypothetical protein H5410_009749 [Solanum commersonii]
MTFTFLARVLADDPWILISCSATRGICKFVCYLNDPSRSRRIFHMPDNLARKMMRESFGKNKKIVCTSNSYFSSIVANLKSLQLEIEFFMQHLVCFVEGLEKEIQVINKSDISKS